MSPVASTVLCVAPPVEVEDVVVPADSGPPVLHGGVGIIGLLRHHSRLVCLPNRLRRDRLQLPLEPFEVLREFSLPAEGKRVGPLDRVALPLRPQV